MKGNFNKLINGERPVLIDFYAVWCGPCKTQAPIINELAKEINGKVRIVKMDIDKNSSVTQRYNIRSVPTLALFKNGKVVWKEAGLKTKSQLIQIIEQNTT